jgi:carbon storage regulator CsrA
MLVLSRRLNEKVLLPTVPAVIEVVAAQGGLVRLGIEAPPEVPILRGELCRGEPAVAAGGEAAAVPLRQALRNRVNNVILGLALLRLQLQDGAGAAMHQTLDGLEEELRALRRHVTGGAPEAPAARAEARLADQARA